MCLKQKAVTTGVQRKCTTGSIPATSGPFASGHAGLLVKQAVVNDMLDDMKSKGVIEEPDSPWSLPVVLVRKKDGSLRFYVDYRRQNDITKKNCFPLPRIDDTLDTLAGAQWCSTLDLKSGYW